MKFNLNLLFSVLMLCPLCIATTSSGDELVSSLIEEVEQLEIKLDELEEEKDPYIRVGHLNPFPFERTNTAQSGKRFRLRHESGKYLTEVGCGNGNRVILRNRGDCSTSQKFEFKNIMKNSWPHFDRFEIWSDSCNKPLYVQGGHNRQCEQHGENAMLKVWDYVADVPHNKFELHHEDGKNAIYMYDCARDYPIDIVYHSDGENFIGVGNSDLSDRYVWTIEYDS